MRVVCHSGQDLVDLQQSHAVMLTEPDTWWYKTIQLANECVPPSMLAVFKPSPGLPAGVC